MKRSLAPLGVALVSLVVAVSASAHAQVSPSVVLTGHGEVFTLVVPTETEGVATTKVELTPPAGFSIDSFVRSPGWSRHVDQSGSGEDAVITKVTWDGGNVPIGEAAAFSFLGRADSSKTYRFAVRQTYSDGSVVDWTGPEGSDSEAPAPTIEAKSSFGAGGSTLAIVALIVGALGVLLGIVALVTASGRRSLA